MPHCTLAVHGQADTSPDWLPALLQALPADAIAQVCQIGTIDSVPNGLAQWDIRCDDPLAGPHWQQLVAQLQTPLVLSVQRDACVELTARTLRRMQAVLEDSGAPLVYSDHRLRTSDGFKGHETIDYQLGSVRDSFDFGPVQLWRTEALQRATAAGGPLSATHTAGLYELRLRVSQQGLPLRIPEPLYTALSLDQRPTGKQQFDYVDPRNQKAQLEREGVASAHLRRINAWLPPSDTKLPDDEGSYPVEASVIIPVRNREKTIGDAVRSALSQQTTGHNVIVVDNHSTDGTSGVLQQLASEDSRLVHLVPDVDDLGIGGCWDYAINSPQVGRYAVQLDSDDVYASDNAVASMVEVLQSGHAMVVGSYRLVDFDLNEIPPGLIDHREWTPENGHNNLLRVNGLGAPRGFRTSVLRTHPIPNVSYGEDYGIGLRLSRDYQIGRIYDALYLCRRWGGNSDADLPLTTKNRYDTYKDRLRSYEILARQTRNRERGT